MNHINAKTLLQINFTIIAGIFIFTTLLLGLPNQPLNENINPRTHVVKENLDVVEKKFTINE